MLSPEGTGTCKTHHMLVQHHRLYAASCKVLFTGSSRWMSRRGRARGCDEVVPKRGQGTNLQNKGPTAGPPERVARM